MSVESWPLAPLLALEHLGTRDFAAFAGISHRTVVRWLSAGLSDQRADELAVRFGHHPGEIWSDWWTA